MQAFRLEVMRVSGVKIMMAFLRRWIVMGETRGGRGGGGWRLVGGSGTGSTMQRRALSLPQIAHTRQSRLRTPSAAVAEVRDQKVTQVDLKQSNF